MKYMVKIEQNPDYYRDHYRAVAYELVEGEWHPVRIIGDGSREEAEGWSQALRIRYGLEGHITVVCIGGPLVAWAISDDAIYFLFESSDTKVMRDWLRRHDYLILQSEECGKQKHHPCGTYRKGTIL